MTREELDKFENKVRELLIETGVDSNDPMLKNVIDVFIVDVEQNWVE